MWTKRPTTIQILVSLLLIFSTLAIQPVTRLEQPTLPLPAEKSPPTNTLPLTSYFQAVDEIQGWFRNPPSALAASGPEFMEGALASGRTASPQGEDMPPDVSGVAQGITQPIEPLLSAGQDTILPAYETQTSPPTPADLVATPDIQITPEIQALAESLGNSPLRIYEFVRNEIAFEPYFASLKGSNATLWSRAGNDYDQASLMLALLRAAGIPSRYVRGLANIPIQQVQDWVGVTDPYVAANMLWWPDRTLYTSGGIPVSLQLEHIWVEAYVPYSNGEGQALDSSGKLWVALDPSFKLKSYQAGIDLADDLDFSRDQYLSGITTDVASEIYADQARDRLAYEGHGQTLSEVAYRGELLPQRLGMLPATLPYPATAIRDEYSELPDTLRHRINFTLLEYSSNRVLIPSTTLRLPQVAQSRITISYTPSGSLLRPNLKVDGTILAAGADIAAGVYTVLRVDINYPLVGITSQVTDYRKAGDLLALGFDVHQASNRLIASRSDQLLAARALFGTPEYDPEAVVGEMLNIASLRYWQRINERNQAVAGYYRSVTNRYMGYSLFTAQTEVAYGSNRPFGMAPVGLNIDVGYWVEVAYNVDGDDSQKKEINRLWGLDSSALEHQLWEEIVAIDSLSTIKGLQFANQSGIPIFTIDQSNDDVLMPQLTLDQGVKDLIQADVNAGYVVTVPRDTLYYYDWRGAVWISEDPATWSAGYWISGSLQGGSVPCHPVHAPCPPPLDAATLGQLSDHCGEGKFPVTYSNGNMHHSFIDILIPTPGLNLTLMRTYNAQSDENGAFGYGWTHNFNHSVSEDPTSGDVTYTNTTGGKYVFVKNGDGSYTPPMGFFSTLIKLAGGFRLRETDGTTFAFNSAGQLTTITDRHNNLHTLTYTGGRLVRVHDALNRDLDFTYNGAGKIATVSDYSGRTWQYSYDTSGNLTSVTTPSDASTPAYTTSYTYYTADPLAHNLKEIISHEGQATRFTYYQNDKIFQTIDASGAASTYFYLPFRNETRVYSPGGAGWAFRYNTNGFVERMVLPDGNLQTRSYDGAGNLVETSDSAGFVTRFTYDDNGNQLSMTDPLGNTVQLTYDPNFSSIASYRDADGNLTTFDIDPANGNVLAIHDALGYVQSFTYTTSGRLASLTDQRSYQTRYYYDANGFLDYLIDPRNQTWQVSFDALGRQTSVANPLGNTISLTYDALDRPLSVTDELNRTRTFQYNAEGQVALLVDYDGRQVSFGFDKLGNLIAIYDAGGYLTSIAYEPVSCPSCNATSRLISITDGNGFTNHYSYDALDRLVAVRGPTGASRGYQYDGRGLLRSMTDEDGHTTRYTYDALGQLLTTQFYDGSQETFSWDGRGNLRSANNAVSALSFEYDARNMLIEASSSALGKSVGYSYDAAGNRATMADPSGATWEYSYDGNDNLLTMKDFNNVITAFSYNSANQVVQAAPQAGHPGVKTNYTYDAGGNLKTLANSSPDGGTSFISLSYSYLPGDLLGSFNASGMSAFAPWSGTTSLEHDGLNRLTGWGLPGAAMQHSQYDSTGNRTSQEISSSVIVSTYDESNRLIYGGPGGDTTYTYDRRGNLIARMAANGQVTRYTWDAESQLTRIDFPDGSYASYSYDALGRRFERRQPNGIITRYFYDGRNVLQEYDAANNLQARYVQTLAWDHPIAMSRGGTTSYYLYDRQGSVLGLTDGAATLLASYVYDAWGNTIGGNAGSSTNPYRFTGREWDAESGLYYYRARYYDPQAGRFISPDPLGMVSSVNTYLYVNDSPFAGSDPSGLIDIPFTDIYLFDAGECEGLKSAYWYAQMWNQTHDPKYYLGGVLSSLWTPETSTATAMTLIPTGGGGSAVAKWLDEGLQWINQGLKASKYTDDMLRLGADKADDIAKMFQEIAKQPGGKDMVKRIVEWADHLSATTPHVKNWHTYNVIVNQGMKALK